ncbi:MAG: hypothetical protein J6M43_06000 [Neisseriaceae bacterium]|nr:hypothetical protein [Neisseriaceae bacterium]
MCIATLSGCLKIYTYILVGRNAHPTLFGELKIHPTLSGCLKSFNISVGRRPTLRITVQKFRTA